MAVVPRMHSKLCFCLRPLRRSMSSSVIYSKYGDPAEVLEMTTTELPSSLRQGEVKVRFLAAPVNPADLNMIQGTYALKPNLPAVGGNEGLAEVLQVGSAVKNLSIGDWVIPSLAGRGTWRTHGVLQEGQLFKLDNRLTMEAAATLSVNPCTAYRMLRDFEKLSSGQCVIQNGANSGVGRAVIQVARNMGLVTVNVIRKREGVDELKKELKDLGADYVLVEEELRSSSVSDIWKKLGEPKLGLNCVGGKSATELMRHLAPKGSLVTYGGMSRQPLTVSTGALIFKDIKILGYWQSRWVEENEKDPERHRMMTELTEMSLKGSLKPSKCIKVPLKDYKRAIVDAGKPMVTGKHLLVMEE